METTVSNSKTLVPVSIIIFFPYNRILCKKISRDGTNDGKHLLKTTHKIYLDSNLQNIQDGVIRGLNEHFVGLCRGDQKYILKRIRSSNNQGVNELYYLKMIAQSSFVSKNPANIVLISFNKLSSRLPLPSMYRTQKIIYDNCEVFGIPDLLYYLTQEEGC